MADTIKIQLSDKYEPVTEADIRRAKNYVLRRESAANGLAELTEALIKDAAENITMLCYQFGVDPKTFRISSSYNERLYDMIAAILDQLEEDIMDLMIEYSLRCTESKDRRSTLLPWVLALGSKGDNLQQLTENRIWRLSRDIEAMIIAVRMTGLDRTKAISRIRSNILSVYTIPEMKYAFAHAAEQKNMFIRSHGVKHGNQGNSNSEAVNILRMVKTTMQMAWMHQQYENYADSKGIWGFGVRRGGSFNCPICDEHTGDWPMEALEHFPPQHANCCCWAFPIYHKDRKEQE